MRTIALISQKGGAGKTTLAIALAVRSERSGIASVLVDLDPQASAAQWSDLREAETPIVTCTPATRLGSVLTAAEDSGAGIVVLDTAPARRRCSARRCACERFRAHPMPARDSGPGGNPGQYRPGPDRRKTRCRGDQRGACRQPDHESGRRRDRRVRRDCLPGRRASENRACPCVYVRVIRI